VTYFKLSYLLHLFDINVIVGRHLVVMQQFFLTGQYRFGFHPETCISYWSCQKEHLVKSASLLQNSVALHLGCHASCMFKPVNSEQRRKASDFCCIIKQF